MKKLLLISALLGTILACKNTANNKNDEHAFESKDLGWKMEIPKDWTIAFKLDSTNRVEASPKDMAVQSSYQPIDDINLKNSATYLLNFKKDDKNSFTAFSEPFDSSFATFDQQIRNTREMFFYTLQQQGLRLDTIWSTETIQGKMFKTFDISAFDKNNQPLFKHIYYNSVINGQMLSAIIRYDSPENKALILDKWKSSSFK